MVRENKAIYAGSFDPFTNGHLDIVKKSLNVFSNVTILIARNSSKDICWGTNDMKNAIQRCMKKEFPNHSWFIDILEEGFVADYCEKHGARYLVRGLRNQMDFLYEENIAKINKELSPSLETVYFRTNDEIVSSSMVREFLFSGKPILKYVPKEIYDLIAR